MASRPLCRTLWVAASQRYITIYEMLTGQSVLNRAISGWTTPGSESCEKAGLSS